MSMVTLVSGGLDSTLMSILAKEEGITLFPLFIDYGQLCKEKELTACLANHKKFGLPTPKIAEISGYAKLVRSGLTDANLRINEDAFLPGRNPLFLLAGCAYAYDKGASAVAIGLLLEANHIFPDQTRDFILRMQNLVDCAFGSKIKIITPLINFSKRDILDLAKQKGIDQTYSCHSGQETPCGICVSCQEILLAQTGRGS
ncbi:MAG: 7-cyano-7-deazaguanine synthase [Dehalococcoides mccartyi]|uniref:7-cyano-7-deazaguanine synthase n=1 Tax=Dehalococcoides mccartyi TaxID=61435 RepID=UPI0030F7AE80